MPTGLAAALQLLFILGVLAAVYVPLGDFMARVYTSTEDLAVERVLYKAARVNAAAEQTWQWYTLSLLGFSFVSVFFLYALQRLQGVLHLGGGLAAVSPAVAFNTAVSFVTNTNWQSYTPETTMGVWTQPLGLAVQNFLSAAVGMAVAIALVRGFVHVREGGEVGNFWVDLVRGAVRVLLPLSLLVAVVLLTQGAVQSLHAGFASSQGQVPLGMAASQEAVKELGTNGGGFFAANSAHPFENPTPFSNAVEIIALLVIPVAFTRTFGTLVGDRRQGLALLAVMAFLWGSVLAATWFCESSPSGMAGKAAGAMLEGKEVRFGVPASVVFAVSTTGTSTGAVNAAHDSFSALGGGALTLNMLFGEIAPGGTGTGLYGLLVLALIAVFVGGLLVGRTPEYLGKKVRQREITLAALAVLVMPALVLAGTGISLVLPGTRAAQGNSGDPRTLGSIHGYSEVLYAYASASNNNGSAFGGLAATSDWFQASLAFCMLLGRFLPIILVLALAGSLVAQRHTPPTAGTLPTHRGLFIGLLVGVVLLVAALTFFPALALGPVAEALG
ncbi:potassium-transporting ATPase, A subunit [Segniliparus rotundus DSM 44985]|uniref:Potassium-transporting ATPase potassium-binding subunit n=1 Tax=Segniliparus rotundus (strain ATCC BAA-972 / CDC 1076 / CIP 108378 / DSM 44985 / JCM 13578) TaxID=640132 RepID=D6ZE64_SEGRD|nr:potassium-transporting ATPase subunit KdpA [Segniliparus rotundus]ADG97344.1 potassium-transporting ATPase, A subunit [Segniliparus rotundus DSM 44985]